jgi:hypothetical protein
MAFIHILHLKDDKYYVGRSHRNASEYLHKHMHGGVNNWTKLYKPLDVTYSVPSSHYSDLDTYVMEYMVIYGIDNVRGGSYSGLTIPTRDYNLIQSEIWKIYDQCARCGEIDHKEYDCVNTHDLNGIEILDDDDDEDSAENIRDDDDRSLPSYDSDNSYFDSSDVDEGYDSYS